MLVTYKIWRDFHLFINRVSKEGNVWMKPYKHYVVVSSFVCLKSAIRTVSLFTI